MKKLVLSLLLVTHAVSASFLGTTKTLVQNYWPTAIFISNFYRNYKSSSNFPLILKETCKKIEHPKIVNFIKKLVNTKKEIHFYCGPLSAFHPSETLALCINDTTVIIGIEYYEFICKIFDKEELSETDKKILDVFAFILEHEIGHIKRGWAPKFQKLQLTLLACDAILFELSKRVYNFKFSKVLTAFTLSYIHTLIIKKTSHPEEFKADDNAKHIEGGIQIMKNIIKNLEVLDFKTSLQYGISLTTHPKVEDRLARLEKRLEESKQLK